MALAIHTERLSKHYAGSVALAGLDLDVNAGEVFGFLGHNGAGKTTTLNILTTLLKPTAGRAWVCGIDLCRDALTARRRLGYLPENVRLYDALTAHENLRFLGRLSGLRNPDGEIRQTLRFLDCEELGARRVGTLSKGQRQRIGLAQAILHRPELLFLDEPTSGLDPLGIKTLRELIVRLNRERGTTVFMNTHLLGEVARSCTSIAVLSCGRLVFHDTLAAALARLGDDTALEQLYLSCVPSVEA